MMAWKQKPRFRDWEIHESYMELLGRRSSHTATLVSKGKYVFFWATYHWPGSLILILYISVSGLNSGGFLSRTWRRCTQSRRYVLYVTGSGSQITCRSAAQHRVVVMLLDADRMRNWWFKNGGNKLCIDATHHAPPHQYPRLGLTFRLLPCSFENDDIIVQSFAQYNFVSCPCNMGPGARKSQSIAARRQNQELQNIAPRKSSSREPHRSKCTSKMQITTPRRKIRELQNPESLVREPKNGQGPV